MVAIVGGCTLAGEVFGIALKWKKGSGNQPKYAAAIGFAAGLYLLCFVAFPEMGAQLLSSAFPKRVEMRLPQGYTGWVYVTHDPSLQSQNPIVLKVPQSGKLRANWTLSPTQEVNASINVHYPDGTHPEWNPGPSEGERNSYFIRPSEQEYEPIPGGPMDDSDLPDPPGIQ